MPILKAEPQIYPDGLLDAVSDPHALDCVLPLSASDVFSSEDLLGRDNDFDEPLAERRWWVLQTKPRQEKSLARDLLARCIPYYLPQVPQTALVRGRRRTSFIPLFSGYLFLFGNDRDRYTSMTTNRIASYLPVVDDIEFTRDLRQIFQLVSAKAPLTVESRLQTGDRVRVKKGTLAGVEGTVIDRRGRCRLLVAVHLLQQGVSMEIDDYMLEPI